MQPEISPAMFMHVFFSSWPLTENSLVKYGSLFPTRVGLTLGRLRGVLKSHADPGEHISPTPTMHLPESEPVLI
jgi:hypothetical protein